MENPALDDHAFPGYSPAMHGFAYRNSSLHCEDVDLSALVQEHGTPLYVYSAGTILDHYKRLDQALDGVEHEVAYAVKANSNLSVLRLLAKEGAAFDIVSGGELFRVIKAGGDPAHCTFAGVGKTRDEIEYALKQGIYSFNVESEAELRYLNEVAQDLGLIAPAAVRVNPNVDAKTHKYISTGKSENKFGVDFEAISDLYARAATELKNVKLRGLQMHIGSQLTSIKPFVEAVEKVTPLVQQLKSDHGIEFWSIGGGIGIVYDHSLDSGTVNWWDQKSDQDRPLTLSQYGDTLLPKLKDLGLKILLEPGRAIVGNAGVLLTECLYEKKGSAKTFKIVDAGMNDLIRPALYEGHHEIVPVKEPGEERVKVDVVGPICESGDFFCQDRELPDFQPGEVIALMSAGAYGFVMASNYNSRPFPAEILVEGAKSSVVRKRQTLDDLIAGEA
ncbi:diaminopimelate decarboxylase [Haloferula sp.]|uniref:diaminopimelate decarboxylase n=1 Tax=Haloferula sp. TaxID=2497595 RepID=UPI00329DA684